MNSDYTCTAKKTNGKTPIGIIINQTIYTDRWIQCNAVAISLDEQEPNEFATAFDYCRNSHIGGKSGWYLPTLDELQVIPNNIAHIQAGLTEAGGTPLSSDNYWTGKCYGSCSPYGFYHVINPVNGTTDYSRTSNKNHFRPIINSSI